MMYPPVRDLAADRIPVAVTCRVLGFSPQAFYAWRANPVSRRNLDGAYALNNAYAIHADDPGLGYRFISDELSVARHDFSERRVWKICHTGGIVSAHYRRRGRSRRPGPAMHDELVQRRFTADGPNRV